MTNNIQIVHETFGKYVDIDFVDSNQFKLFIQMVHSCLVSKKDFSFFNGESILIHIPKKHLKESIITTNTNSMSMSEHMKLKIETVSSNN